MARKEADLMCCAITQALHPDYWTWDTAEKAVLQGNDVKQIADIIKTRLEKVGCDIQEMYAIIHDQDIQQGWDDTLMQTVVTYKSHHIHCTVKFNKGATLPVIANAVGLAPQYVEKAGRGKYGYDNLLSYLTHIKYPEKFQYDPKSVATICGRPYLQVYTERKEEWLKGRAKLEAERNRADIDWLEAKIVSGELTKNQILLTDEYFMVYARNKRRCDDAFDTYGQRRVARTIRAMENGEFKTSVIFITGKSHSGKSQFTDYLVKDIIRKAKVEMGESWSYCSVASSNPFDDYQGEEILIMDDLRGVALTASDWLKLLDPDRVNRGSARYRNKMMACRVIIINSEKDALDFFYYLKNSGGGDRSEAMDQFFRRIMARAIVYRVPDSDERRIGIGTMQETDAYQLEEPGTHSIYGHSELTLHHDFVETDETRYMEYGEALNHLTEMVMQRNRLQGVVPLTE